MQERVLGLAVDLAGNAYVAGETYSPDFPTTPGAFEASFLGSGVRAFVSKLNQTGTGLVYSTFLNAAGATAIAVDSGGNAYVTGGAYGNFPTTPSAFQRTAGGEVDVFVAKINPQGSSLIYATFHGGSDFEVGHGIAIDSSGNAYVTGETRSTNFPVTQDAFQKANGGGSGGPCGSVGRVVSTPLPCTDAFVAVVNPVGSELLYSTYIGGNGLDSGSGIVVDSRRSVYITGQIISDFRTTIGSSQSGYVLAVRIAMAPPTITSGGIVNGASFRDPTDPNGAVALGAIVSIFGADLAGSTQVAQALPLPTTLGGTIVTFNGIPAPLFFVSPSQINAQVPFEVTPGTVSVQVKRGATSEPQQVSIAGFSPGIFTLNRQGTGAGAILHADTFELVSETNPARPGEFVSIFCTGLGRLRSAVASGQIAPSPPPETLSLPQVNIAGIPSEVTFSGLAAGFVGLYQVNVRVPAGVPSGNAVPVVLTINSVPSNTVSIAVQ